MAKVILLIEDEPVLQKTFGDLLTKEGYKMISALDGEVGLKLADPPDNENKPDLILLDLILPKIHGFEVLKKLKENQRTRDIPVIVLTNLGEIEDVEKALQLGVSTYLVKTNYTLEEVLDKIKKAINNS